MGDKSTFVSNITLPEFALWDKLRQAKGLVSFELELTSRCNLNCRHCYINLPVSDKEAQEKEFSLGQIEDVADQAVSLGALWCLLTGGEPFLRQDFQDIYLCLKKKGLLVSVFTNATLLSDEHICLFKKYPPRDIEITVYGMTPQTYERVTRQKGSFQFFMRGLNLLLENGVKVRLKAMALRSNVQELPEIAKFCRQHTKDYFRFDPLLHLRFDGNSERNEEIKSERLSPEEIAEVEQKDPERSEALNKNCAKLINDALTHTNCNHLFHCGTGRGSFTLSYDGHFRLCSSLWQKDCLYDLKKGSLRRAYEEFVPQVRELRSSQREFLEKCHRCSIINLCLWCPAHAYLETGSLDTPVDYFCAVARARAEALRKNMALTASRH
jgi:radical SAM protein with 4Fe4S-binding SPASM domain